VPGEESILGPIGLVDRPAAEADMDAGMSEEDDLFFDDTGSSDESASASEECTSSSEECTSSGDASGGSNIGTTEAAGETAAADEDKTDEDKDEEGDSKGNANVSLGLINSGPVSIDQPVDEPVTSGGPN
jgi:hypothetical protein